MASRSTLRASADPQQRRPLRRVFLLIAYNSPSSVSVHRIKADGIDRRGGAAGRQARLRHLCAPDSAAPGNQSVLAGDARQQCDADNAGGSGRAAGVRLQGRRAQQQGRSSARQWARLRPAPSRFPSDAAVGVRVDRAPEPDLCLRAHAGRRAFAAATVRQEHDPGSATSTPRPRGRSTCIPTAASSISPIAPA